MCLRGVNFTICQLHPSKAGKSHLEGFLKPNAGSHPAVSGSVGRHWSQECVFLVSSWVVLPYLVPESHFENHRPPGLSLNFSLCSRPFLVCPHAWAAVSVLPDQPQARHPSGRSTFLSCLTFLTQGQASCRPRPCLLQPEGLLDLPSASQVALRGREAEVGGGGQGGSDQAAGRDLSYLGHSKSEPFWITPGHFLFVFHWARIHVT